MGMTIETRPDGVVEVRGGSVPRWTFKHFPAHSRTVLLQHTALGRVRRFPGLVLAVPYDDKKPLALYAFRRVEPLTGSLDDSLEIVNMLSSYDANGRVCIGQASRRVREGMSPEDAFWNTSFYVSRRDEWMPVRGSLAMTIDVARAARHTVPTAGWEREHWGFS